MLWSYIHSKQLLLFVFVTFNTCTCSGVRRLNLGGKALTNLLKETVSYRSLDMRDEGLLMEQLKEQLCWVSQVRVGYVCVGVSCV